MHVSMTLSHVAAGRARSRAGRVVQETRRGGERAAREGSRRSTPIVHPIDANGATGRGRAITHGRARAAVFVNAAAQPRRLPRRVAPPIVRRLPRA
ncbi:hypothetical protein CFB46_34500 [Burkholderia sp. HI2761]|nr:hypothetical protein CFB46_34500 [Burkholderia sp. HI2761]